MLKTILKYSFVVLLFMWAMFSILLLIGSEQKLRELEEKVEDENEKVVDLELQLAEEMKSKKTAIDTLIRYEDVTGVSIGDLYK